MKADVDYRLLEEPPTMEFGRDGKSHTAGWAFSIGRDDLTDRALTQTEVSLLEKSAIAYLERFRSSHPELERADFFTLKTACCNYKRGHKGSRYQFRYKLDQGAMRLWSHSKGRSLLQRSATTLVGAVHQPICFEIAQKQSTVKGAEGCVVIPGAVKPK